MGATTRIVETEEQDPLTVQTLQAALSTAMQSMEYTFSERLEKLFTPIKAQLAEIQASLSKTCKWQKQHLNWVSLYKMSHKHIRKTLLS